MKAFITGSRAYGTPRLDSDIDLVIQYNAATAALLRKESEAKNTVRFGRLNVIIAGDDPEMAAWQLGTDALQREVAAHGPFDKETTHGRFEKLREMVGIEYQGSD